LFYTFSNNLITFKKELLTIWKTKKVGYEPERENVPEKNQNIGKNIFKKLLKNRKCRKKRRTYHKT